VIPAYRPDPALLVQYVDSLRSTIDPATIRIELDAPTQALHERLAGEDIAVNAVDERRGKGAAIADGFDVLATDIVAFADADGSTPADELASIIGPVETERADIAVGSRRHPDATVASSQSLVREQLGDGFAWLARRALDVNLYDYQCGAKALTATCWDEIRQHMTNEGFAWDVELLAIGGALDCQIREVPIEWHDHPDSTVPPLQTALELGKTLLSTRRRALDIQRTHAGVAAEASVDQPTVLTEQETPSENND
jgi:glycosyltransferase involved in cell wall biosynthesis